MNRAPARPVRTRPAALVAALTAVLLLGLLGPTPAAQAAPGDDTLLVEVLQSNGTGFVARTRADGSHQRRVTPVDGAHTWSGLSPDHRSIALWNHDTTDRIVVGRPDGTRLHTVLDVPQIGASPTWTPDSSRMVLLADQGTGMQVVALDPGTRAVTPLADAAAVQLSFPGPDSFSPDASLAILHGYDGDGHLAYYRVRMSGGGLAFLGGWTAYARRPQGRRAVAVRQSADGAEVVLLGARLGVVKVLARLRRHADAVGAEAAWSADGSRVAVLVGRDGHQRVRVYDAAGHPVRTLTPPQRGVARSMRAYLLGISPDGTVVNWSYGLVGTPKQPDQGLYLGDVQRGRTCQVTHAGGDRTTTTVRYAPDMRYVLLGSFDLFARRSIVRPGARNVAVDLAPGAGTPYFMGWLTPTRRPVDAVPCR